jgi:hypothetical protein
MTEIPGVAGAVTRPRADVVTITMAGELISEAPSASPLVAVERLCPGLVIGMPPTGTVRRCVRQGGHAGDHLGADGYRWNDERWLD